MPLRDYQQRAVDQFEPGSLLVSPTGTGKTVMMAVKAAQLVAREKRRVLWVAPRKELVKQAIRALEKEWLTPGVNIEVRTLQEIRASKSPPPADDLFVDEAHHLGGEDWSRIVHDQYPMATLRGGTATPVRADGKAMDVFRRIVEAISVREAIERGFLVQPHTFRPERPLKSGELAQDPIKAYLEKTPGKKAILFAGSVETAIQYACDFRAKDVRAAAVWGAMGLTRDVVLKDFEEGRLDVLTSVNVLTEGFDVPATEVAILARAFGSAAAYIQAVGRALRPADGKSSAVVLDLVGAWHVHGDVDVPRTFHLEGKPIRRDGEDVKIRFCPVCGFPTMSDVCEQCAYAGEMRLRKPRVLGLPIDRFARFQQDTDEQRARYLAREISECRDKGYKPGRAMHKYNGKYLGWPTPEVQAMARKMLSDRQ